VRQTDVATTLSALWAAEGMNAEAVARLQRAATVETRNFVLPIEAYVEPRSFTAANDLFIEASASLCEEAIRDALSASGVSADAVDLVMVVTTSGLATPSLDARLVNRVGLRRDVKRLPIFGLGCVGGAAGLARCGDYLRGFPGHVALLVAVELCSLTFQRDDSSTVNAVGSSLFGDGAAAAVLTGLSLRITHQGPLPRLIDSRSVLYQDTEDVLGWHIGETGFRLNLRNDLPSVATSDLRGSLEGMLAAHGLAMSDVGLWAVHPGGPRVLRSVAEALDLPPEALHASWESLRSVGNVSSVSTLLILGDLMRNAERGAHGVVIGMGPGFSVESLLFEWT
jgi:alkylresorcinol/alkylpyrone synthase